MEAVGNFFKTVLVDGQDLADLKGRPVHKQLAKAGVDQAEAAVQVLLRERDSMLTKRDSGSGEATECPLCFEGYRDDDSGRHVPRILPCGHAACQGCYAKMLRPINAEPNSHVKKLECPECRVVTEVPCGRADRLQKVFALLR